MNADSVNYFAFSGDQFTTQEYVITDTVNNIFYQMFEKSEELKASEIKKMLPAKDNTLLKKHYGQKIKISVNGFDTELERQKVQEIFDAYKNYFHESEELPFNIVYNQQIPAITDEMLEAYKQDPVNYPSEDNFGINISSGAPATYRRGTWLGETGNSNYAIVGANITTILDTENFIKELLRIEHYGDVTSGRNSILNGNPHSVTTQDSKIINMYNENAKSRFKHESDPTFTQKATFGLENIV